MSTNPAPRERVYLVSDGRRDNWTGDYWGRVVREDGSLIGGHVSSTLAWLRRDLLAHLDDPDKYEVVDLIGEPIPDRFREAD